MAVNDTRPRFREGAWDKVLKSLGPLGSITTAEKHFNTKHWVNDMIIIPIEVLENIYTILEFELSTQHKYLQLQAQKLEQHCSLDTRPYWKEFSLGYHSNHYCIPSQQVWRLHEVFPLFRRANSLHWWKSHSCDMCDYLCETLENHSSLPHKIYYCTLSLRPACSRSHLRSFLRCLGKERWHGGEGERKMIDTFRCVWHCRLTCGLICPLFQSILMYVWCTWYWITRWCCHKCTRTQTQIMMGYGTKASKRCLNDNFWVPHLSCTKFW